jgi:hypothetical protein
LSGGPEDLDRCIERLLEYEQCGVNEVALLAHGDPGRAIRLLGQRVVPAVQKDEA